MKSSWQTLKPFIRLFKRQWLMMMLGVLLSITTLLAGIGLLSLSGWFLSATAIAGLTVATAQAFNFFTPSGGVRFLSITRTASRYGERLATHEATFKLLTELRVWTWQKLLPLSDRNLQGMRKGDLLNRFVADIDTLDHLYLRLLVPVGASIIVIGLLYTFIAWFDRSLAFTLCGFLLLLWLCLPLVFYKLGKQPGQELIHSKQAFRVGLLDVLQGQAELSLFNANTRYLSLLKQAETRFFNSQAAMAKLTGLSQALLILGNGTAVLLMLWLASFAVGNDSPPGPLFAMVVFATMASLEMMMPIAGAFQHLSSTLLAAQRVQQITEQTPDISFGENTLQAKYVALSISDVSFGYQAQSLVLSDLHLKINQGQHIAILGETGCGKSSLFALITRQWQPQQGKLSINGTDISEFDESSLRNMMSVLSQRVDLFAGTLRDNLRIALPYDEGEKRKAHDAKLIEVLQQVGLGNLLVQDNPLEQWIGDGGRQLSGGEQRRIGVARVLLRDAPLLLLDEPTEGLDKRTEQDIMQTILTFAKGKTLIMISHRLTALDKMDACYEMKQGKLVS